MSAKGFEDGAAWQASRAPQPTEDDREYDPDLAAFLSQSLDDEPMWSCVVIAKNLHAAGFRRAPAEPAVQITKAMLEQPTLLGLVIEPTIAMRQGKQLVFQCAQCGLIAVQTDLAPGALGACPACSRGSWWAQSLPVAGLHESSDLS